MTGGCAAVEDIAREIWKNDFKNDVIGRKQVTLVNESEVVVKVLI